MIWVIKRVREALPEMIELNHIGYHIGYLFKVKMRGTSFLSVFQGLKVFGSNPVTPTLETLDLTGFPFFIGAILVKKIFFCLMPRELHFDLCLYSSFYKLLAGLLRVLLTKDLKKCNL